MNRNNSLKLKIRNARICRAKENPFSTRVQVLKLIKSANAMNVRACARLGRVYVGLFSGTHYAIEG